VDVAGVMDAVSDARAQICEQAEGELAGVLCLSGVHIEEVSDEYGVIVIEGYVDIALVALAASR